MITIAASSSTRPIPSSARRRRSIVPAIGTKRCFLNPWFEGENSK